jgi:hypothetical protein
MSVALFILAAVGADSAQSDDLAVRAMHNFGECIVRQSPSGAVEQLLEMDYRTDEYRKKLRKMAKGHDRCIAGGWKIGSSQLLVAGAMAEALLEAQVKPGDLPQRLAVDPARRAIEARSPIEAMALCTALKAPQPTSRLMSTEPATREETEAMKEIGPVLTNCLTKDVKVELNKPALRAVLALAAWRIASAEPTASEGSQ